jgi:hypothetical protein
MLGEKHTRQKYLIEDPQSAEIMMSSELQSLSAAEASLMISSSVPSKVAFKSGRLKNMQLPDLLIRCYASSLWIRSFIERREEAKIQVGKSKQEQK